MVLSLELERRMSDVGYDYEGQPKQRVERCNLCSHDAFVLLTHRDRYGFEAETSCCRRCGLVFLDPVMTQEAYGAFYREVYRPLVSAFHGRTITADTIEEEQETYAAALARLLEPYVEGRGGATLLDVGGSTGVVAEMLARRFTLEATVLDPAPAEIERARLRGLGAVTGTVESFEPDTMHFDIVTMCQTVDHLLDVAGALAKMRRLIGEEGVLFLDIVDFRAAYLRARCIEGATKIDHPYYLTQPTAEAYLRRAGFRILRTDYAADHLHVGYVCAPGTPVPELPTQSWAERLLAEIRLVQNTPAPR